MTATSGNRGLNAQFAVEKMPVPFILTNVELVTDPLPEGELVAEPLQFQVTARNGTGIVLSPLGRLVACHIEYIVAENWR